MKKQNNLEILDEKLLRDELERLVSLKMYEFLGDLSESLIHRVGADACNDILINSLTINLGHVIGQLSPSDQRKYSVLAKKTIKEHTLLGTMAKERYVHGNIGQA